MFGEILGGLVGGLLGGDDQTATQQQKMDPRMDAYVYGKDGQGGLLGTAYGLMNKQLKTGGMNPMMQAGLEGQRQFLTSPQYMQGYNNLMNMGQGLLGGGVAGNPFNQGTGFVRAPASNMPMLDRQPFQGGFQYQTEAPQPKASGGSGSGVFSGFPFGLLGNVFGTPTNPINAMYQPMQFDSAVLPEPEKPTEEPEQITNHNLLSSEAQTMYRKMLKQGLSPEQALFEAQRATFVGG